jgi:hypothetical protein
MFRQLILDGFIRPLTAYVFSVAVLATSLAIRRAEENLVSTTILFVVASLYFLVNWRKLSTQCVDREFTYRRLNGKWRWES